MASLSLRNATFAVVLVALCISHVRVHAERTYLTKPVPLDVESPEPCESGDSGLFGELGAGTVPVYFDYELEHDPTKDTATMMKDLENAFLDKMLPLVFPEACSMPVAQRSELGIVGASANPPEDVVIPDYPCSIGLKTNTNECAVFDGGISLYTETDPDGNRKLDSEYSDLVQSIRDFIAKSMNEGDFDEAHPAVVRVSWADSTLSGAGDTEDGADGTPEVSANSNGLSTPAIVAIALSCVFVVGAALLWRRRSRTDDEDAETFKTRDQTIEGATAGLESQEASQTMDFTTIVGNEPV